MTTITNLLVSFGAYMIGSLVRLAIIAALTPVGGYHASYRDNSLTMYFSSITADLPLLVSGITAGFLSGRFTLGRDFGWALVPALMYLINSGSALFREQTFQMWLILTGLPSVYASVACVAVAYWSSRRPTPTA